MKEENKYQRLAYEIIEGRRLDTDDAPLLETMASGDLQELCTAANYLRQEMCGTHVDLCTIVNGKSGRCSENCKFCAQSSHYHTDVDNYPFMSLEEIMVDCKRQEANGVHGYSIVTAGRTLSDTDFQKEIAVYQKLHTETGVRLCASNGLLTETQLRQLKEAGVENYHCNIETAKSNFSNICSTHTYEDKLEEIRRAKAAGLQVCSGGIIGMGETFSQRIEMALALAELEIRSIPVNVLIPIPGTALGDLESLSNEEVLRTVAMFRFVNPLAYIRIAAGRKQFKDGGAALFKAGANAAITGDMLTTVGNQTRQDIDMLCSLGFTI